MPASLKHLRSPFPFLILLCLFLCSGCFEVVEELAMNEDGSGTITMTVNMSQSRSELKSIMLLDTINGYQVPKQSQIRSEIERTKKILASVEGVSNIVVKEDFETFIFSVKFSFSNIQVLNNAIAITGKTMTRNNIDPSGFSYFSFDGKQFKRRHHREANKRFKQLKQKDRDVLKGATYTSIYRFNKPIRSFSNAQARLSKSKKALFLKSDIKYLFSDQQKVDHTISF